MAAIGDLILGLGVNFAQFESDLVKGAQKAGDKAGASMGQRIGTAAKAGLTVAGGAAGALFGIAAKGANDLTNAMADFRRETGATQEEVESAQASVLELSRSNLQSFDEIARAQAKLRTDLGLTQAQAEEATQAFLDYGTATGRDAAEGVGALDDILDAWNLDASKSNGIMDQLIASHQKYGGSISDNERALAELAPQLQALGATTDDGIALLNLFAASGLDASKATFALNTAVRTLKPGQDLDDLVAQIASIEDPTERAQEAIKVFGSRGGVSLANALRPGITGLGEFGISADEAAGSFTEASEAIKNTPFNQVTLALKNLAGPLVDAGKDFAPLILAFSQLGGGKLITAASAAIGAFATSVLPKLVGALSKPFASLFTKAIVGPITFGLEEGISAGAVKVQRSGKVGRAMDGLGRFMGSRLGRFLGVAFAAVAVVEVFNTYNNIRAGLNEQAAQINEDVANQIASGTDEQLRQSAAALQEGIDKLDKAGFIFGSEQADNLRRQLEATLAELERRAQGGAVEVPAAVADELEEGADLVDEAAQEMVAPIPRRVHDASTTAALEASLTPGSIADGIKNRRDAVDTAMAELQEAMENPMNTTKERAKLIGLLTSQELADGLESQDPYVKRKAQETRQVLLDQLNALPLSTDGIGKEASKFLADGLKSKDPAVRAAAQHVKDIIDGKLQAAKDAASGWGRGLGSEYAKGLRSTFGIISEAAAYAVKGVVGPMKPSSPPREGPAHDIDRWGPDLMRVFAEPLAREGYRIIARASSRAMRGLQAGTLRGIPSMADRLASVAPSIAPRAMPAFAAAGGGSCGGDTYNNNLTVTGVMPVETVRDATSALRRLQETGHLRSRRREALYPLRSHQFRSTVVRRG